MLPANYSNMGMHTPVTASVPQAQAAMPSAPQTMQGGLQALASNMPQQYVQPQQQQQYSPPQAQQYQQNPSDTWGGWSTGQQAAMYGNAGQTYGNNINDVNNWGYGQNGSNFGQSYVNAMQNNQQNANAINTGLVNTNNSAAPIANPYAAANAANMGYTGPGGGGTLAAQTARQATDNNTNYSDIFDYRG